jgi:hypothetical protein
MKGDRQSSIRAAPTTDPTTAPAMAPFEIDRGITADLVDSSQGEFISFSVLITEALWIYFISAGAMPEVPDPCDWAGWPEEAVCGAIPTLTHTVATEALFSWTTTAAFQPLRLETWVLCAEKR